MNADFGGDHNVVGDTELGDALPHADYQGCSADEAKRLSREACGAEPGGNNGERLHAGL